jgi:fatty acid desaturase
MGLPVRRAFLMPRHGALNVAHVLATHALLVAWLWLGPRLLPLSAWVPLSVLACLVHQRAMSEWIHEGAHHNLVASRRWNDFLTNLLGGIWFVLPVAGYRATHLEHHARDAFFEDADPDTRFLAVGSRRALWWAVVRDLSGATVLRQYLRFDAPREAAAGWRPFLAAALATQAALLALLYAAGRLDALVLYYGTLATAYPLLNRLRTYGQHVRIAADGRAQVAGSPASRTIDAGLLDRIVFTSPRLLYHYEHHRNPHLPWRALPGLVVPTDDVNRWAPSRWAVLRAVWAGLPASVEHPEPEHDARDEHQRASVGSQ